MQTCRIALRTCFVRAVLVGLASVAGCVGSPTPEPPDSLPKPDVGLISVAPTEVSASSTYAPLPIEGQPGAADGADVLWVVNLDQRQVAVDEAVVAEDGSFDTRFAGVPGDRIRIVARTDAQHSSPVDFELVESTFGKLGVSPARDESLACLTVTPAVELDLEGDGEAPFTIDSACEQAVEITRAALRFGDQGFTLVSAPTEITPGTRAEIIVRLDEARDEERADVLLLDVQAGSDRGRYALGVWGSK